VTDETKSFALEGEVLITRI